jgi:hypothetical protein
MNRVAQPSRLRVHAASRRAHSLNRAGRPANPQAKTPAPQGQFESGSRRNHWPLVLCPNAGGPE